MKLSLKWLNELIDVSDYFKKPEALGEILTQAGLEVEQIENQASRLENVFVGLVLKKDKHPNSDRLSLCQVATGENVIHQIVCGAQNHKDNDKIIVALPGAVLPGNMNIQKAIVRGVESSGMLCSLKELGMAETSEGIEILPADAPVGMAYAHYRELDDVILELKVTPNRADCLSHLGLARELACLLKRELKIPAVSLAMMSQDLEQKVSVQVLNPELCPRYSGRVLHQVKVGPSPNWLKSRLESLGLKSINNVVDLTNFVMLEMGQPLHAFDFDKIEGRQIKIGLAQKDESFISLDGSEFHLSAEDLCVRDEKSVLALAGVIGGKNSGVFEETQTLFLESAYFKSAPVRRTSKRFGINTDSAYRFSRGVDPDLTRLALDRACQLIQKTCGGVVASEVVDIYPNPEKRVSSVITHKMVVDSLGFDVPREEIVSMLKQLGCEVSGENEILVTPPNYRFDLDQPMDYVEEVARLKGYEAIPESFPALRQAPAEHSEAWRLQLIVSDCLRACGLSQALNFAFVSETKETSFLGSLNSIRTTGLMVSDMGIKILNPLSEELNQMRKCLSFGLWQNAIHNFRQGREHGALFEMGSAFIKSDTYLEEGRIAAVAWGNSQNLWSKNLEVYPLFHLKSSLENLFRSLGIKNFTFETPTNKGQIPSYLHRGRAALIKIGDLPIGFIGEIHPQLRDTEKFRVPLALFEITTKLFVGKEIADRYKGFSRFPSVERDLALLVPKTLAADAVGGLIKESGGPLVNSCVVFDQYEGSELPLGTRSLAYRIGFQDFNASLNDAQVQTAMSNILDSLKQKWGLVPR